MVEAFSIGQSASFRVSASWTLRDDFLVTWTRVCLINGYTAVRVTPIGVEAVWLVSGTTGFPHVRCA